MELKPGELKLMDLKPRKLEPREPKPMELGPKKLKPLKPMKLLKPKEPMGARPERWTSFCMSHPGTQEEKRERLPPLLDRLPDLLAGFAGCPWVDAGSGCLPLHT